MVAQIEVEVSDNPGLHRYEARIGAIVAGFAVYRLEDERTVFTHTVVGDDWEGHGIGSALAHFALDDVIAAGRQVTPICPFFVAYISKHPKYVASVDQAHQAQFS
jgi:predicted GNAT family acetyltransferase